MSDGAHIGGGGKPDAITLSELITGKGAEVFWLPECRTEQQHDARANLSLALNYAANAAAGVETLVHMSAIGADPDAHDDEIDAAAADGHSHLRIDMPWARAEPRPGALDGDVVEELLRAADRAHHAGMTVWCRLLQADVPRWFDNEGGFGDDRTAARWWPRWVDRAAELVVGGEYTHAHCAARVQYAAQSLLHRKTMRRRDREFQRIERLVGIFTGADGKKVEHAARKGLVHCRLRGRCSERA